jgi:hypothetical protein
MKNRLGWSLATLAILTFSFGQASAAASQIATANRAAVAVPQAAVPAAAKPAVVKPAAAAPAAVAPAAVKQAAPAAVKSSVPAAVMNAPTDPKDESKVPHYFGPYPNWANSPQVLSNAVVTMSSATGVPVTVGNPLIGRAVPSDSGSPAGALAPIFVVLPNAKMPAGTLQSFKIWNQGVTYGGARLQGLRASADWCAQRVHSGL